MNQKTDLEISLSTFTKLYLHYLSHWVISRPHLLDGLRTIILWDA